MLRPSFVRVSNASLTCVVRLYKCVARRPWRHTGAQVFVNIERPAVAGFFFFYMLSASRCSSLLVPIHKHIHVYTSNDHTLRWPFPSLFILFKLAPCTLHCITLWTFCYGLLSIEEHTHWTTVGFTIIFYSAFFAHTKCTFRGVKGLPWLHVHQHTTLRRMCAQVDFRHRVLCPHQHIQTAGDSIESIRNNSSLFEQLKRVYSWTLVGRETA